jgi:hypothetical protein
VIAVPSSRGVETDTIDGVAATLATATVCDADAESPSSSVTVNVTT